MSAERPEYRFASWLYLRLLALVYLVAFASLGVQVRGLYGADGILPVSQYLEVVALQVDEPQRYFDLPTLFWLNAGDLALVGLCAVGALVALAALLGLGHRAAFALLWALYLSFVAAGQDFLAFQWDGLLLEAGLLAIFLTPVWRLRREPRPPQPSKLALWLHWWLLFRLVWSSGVVKLTSGDATWRDLSALLHHYETQPIPNRIAWILHQLPDFAHQAAVAGMFVVELLVPLAIFGPARFKRAAFLLMAAFQIALAVTGNFAFFNLLTLALCLLLLDDDWWRAAMPHRLGQPGFFSFVARDLLVAPLAALVLVVSGVRLVGALRLDVEWPRPVLELTRRVAPFRSINGYGLFAVMTTERLEIEVQGTLDGGEWRAYEFKYKPGSLVEPPPFVAPHQPRLDWQMWFAALERGRPPTWFYYFLARLAEGSPDVFELLAADPFEGETPQALRALVYDYRFTDVQDRWQSDAWWSREFRGVYLEPTPAASLLRLFPAPD